MSMSTGTVDPETRDAATFILSGAVGVGLGVAVGMLLAESVAVVAASAALGAVAGHLLGYLVVRRRRDRFV